MEHSVVASAPGKLILFGEHAVVSGEPAVATCLSLRTWCRVTSVHGGTSVTLTLDSLGNNSSGVGVICSWDVSRLSQFALEHSLEPEKLPNLSPEFLAAIGSLANGVDIPSQHLSGVSAFLLLYFLTGPANRGLSAKVWSTLPVGAGLGSSAAFSASVCGALAKASSLSLDKEILNKWTFHAERVLHGNPSGIDNSVAIFGGCLVYTKAGGISVLSHMPLLPLLLIDTRVPRSTQKLVAGVLQRRDAFPAVMLPVLGAIGHISRTAVDLFGQAELPRSELLQRLNTLIDMNQGLLECIGVSHPSIRQVINTTLPCNDCCSCVSIVVHTKRSLL